MPHLLAYAEERENEKALAPLWVAHYVVSKLTGKDPVPFESLITHATASDDGSDDQSVKRNPTEIELDFDEIICRDRQSLKKGGVAIG